MNAAEAMTVLEKLHYVIGESCVRLSIVDTYPDFDPQYVHMQKEEKTPLITLNVAEVEIALIQKIAAISRRHMKPASLESTERKIVDVHVDPSVDAKNKSKNLITTGTDSGANSKTSYQYLARFISDAQAIPGRLSGV